MHAACCKLPDSLAETLRLVIAAGLSWKQQVDAAVEKLKERLSGSRPTFFFKAKGTAAVEEPGASSKGKKGGGGGRGGGRAGASVKQQQPMGCVMQLVSTSFLPLPFPRAMCCICLSFPHVSTRLCRLSYLSVPCITGLSVHDHMAPHRVCSLYMNFFS